MKLLLDEMYSPDIAAALRDRGYDVVSVKDRIDLVGASDSELIAAMRAEKRSIVTNNAVDFAPLTNQLAANAEDHYGVFLTSDRSFPRSRKTIGTFVRALTELLDSGIEAENEVRWIA